MAKKKRRELDPLIFELMNKYDVSNILDLQSLMKDLLKDGVSILLDGEMDETLGYSKNQRSSNKTNSRNGYNSKSVKTSFGNVEFDIPRDRNAEFDPQVIPKHSRDISDIDDKIISMFSRGMSVSNINEHLEDLYGLSYSGSQISRITDKVIGQMEDWKNRPLKSCYPFVFMDAIHFNVRSNNKIIKKAAYVIIGIDLEGKKDILSITIGENETSKFWLKELEALRVRGIEEILIMSVDNLRGFTEAISAIFPETKIQKCIVHQIRNTLKYLNYKERKSFAKELKSIYTAIDEPTGFKALETLNDKYPDYSVALKSWFVNWAELSEFFNYPTEIRKIMYTTNIIESLNSSFRRTTKARNIFPTDQSLMKILYLSSINITKKWTQKIRGWNKILRMLSIEFEERIEGHL